MGIGRYSKFALGWHFDCESSIRIRLSFGKWLWKAAEIKGPGYQPTLLTQEAVVGARGSLPLFTSFLVSCIKSVFVRVRIVNSEIRVESSAFGIMFGIHIGLRGLQKRFQSG